MAVVNTNFCRPLLQRRCHMLQCRCRPVGKSETTPGGVAAYNVGRRVELRIQSPHTQWLPATVPEHVTFCFVFFANSMEESSTFGDTFRMTLLATACPLLSTPCNKMKWLSGVPQHPREARPSCHVDARRHAPSPHIVHECENPWWTRCTILWGASSTSVFAGFGVSTLRVLLSLPTYLAQQTLDLHCSHEKHSRRTA